MKIYHYVDMTRGNTDGTFPVYLIVKTATGRFFVSTKLTAGGKLTGMVFPKSEPNGRQKTAMLCRYISETERVCLEGKMLELTNCELKARIQQEVFGVVPRSSMGRLADCIGVFADTKRVCTRTLYNITRRKVEAFDGKRRLNEVNAQWLERFRQWCMADGMTINGAGKELRNIRAVFNWARKRGVTANYPFLDYSIVEEETLPNNISVADLRRLRDYCCEPWQKPYVDFFMLSFYLAGINPGDLLLLPADAVKDGHLSFVRRKTDKQGQRRVRTVVLPVVPEAAEIISRYPSRKGWLLSFMDGRNDYRSFVRGCNDALKKVGTSEVVPDKVGKMRKVLYHPILPNVTLYTARYTFGSIAANDLDISERTIGQCLGHSWSRNVTCRYVAHDQRKVDLAVKRVADYVSSS